MHLTEFSVVHASDDYDGTIIHCFAGPELVLALVQRNALGDYFHWPKPGRDVQRPSLSECHLVVDRNLAAFEPIIQEKFRMGAYGVLNRAGSSLKMIIVSLADIKQSGADLSDTIIDMTRSSRFVRV